ncbi:MAG: hypothetical protein WC867_04880 [Candidatus Pacearchaeota archaeon]|jgi:hypothetical protein
MLHDMFKQGDVDTTEELSPGERKDLLRTLGCLWGGMTGAPQSYSIHAGLKRNDEVGDDKKNYHVLLGNTAELRKGVLIYKGYSWTSSTGEISSDSPQRFLQDLEHHLKYAGSKQLKKDIETLAGFYYNNGNPKVYDDFDSLKEAICKAGLPRIGENLYLPQKQNDWEKLTLAESLDQGTTISLKKFWQGNVLLHIPKGMSRSIGNYMLID